MNTPTQTPAQTPTKVMLISGKEMGHSEIEITVAFSDLKALFEGYRALTRAAAREMERALVYNLTFDSKPLLDQYYLGNPDAINKVSMLSNDIARLYLLRLVWRNKHLPTVPS